MSMIRSYGVSTAETIEKGDGSGCDGCMGKAFCVQVKGTRNGTTVRLISCDDKIQLIGGSERGCKEGREIL